MFPGSQLDDRLDGQISSRRKVYLPKVNASPAEGATIIMNVSIHLIKYGPMGVPKGFVETQKLVKGNTPCLGLKISTPAFQLGDHQHTFRSHESFAQSQSVPPKGFQMHSEGRGSLAHWQRPCSLRTAWRRRWRRQSHWPRQTPPWAQRRNKQCCIACKGWLR